jgi:predicted neuraminidase
MPNPGSGLEVIRLRTGSWLMICNDVDDGRYRLAAIISEDEGRTWPHRTYLENDAPGPGSGSYSYPSVIQAQDGAIHVSYSYARRDLGSAIEHARFSEPWMKA